MPIKTQDTVPLLYAFGAAVFEGQHLENGLKLLLKLIDHELAAKGRARTRLVLDSPSAHRKLGELFDEVQSLEYLTNAERKAIQKGLRTRNLLVHAYWQQDRTNKMETPAGRRAIFADLDQLGGTCRKAGRIVDALIDQKLAQAGTSLDELSRPIWEQWESDDSLH